MELMRTRGVTCIFETLTFGTRHTDHNNEMVDETTTSMKLSNTALFSVFRAAITLLIRYTKKHGVLKSDIISEQSADTSHACLLPRYVCFEHDRFYATNVTGPSQKEQTCLKKSLQTVFCMCFGLTVCHQRRHNFTTRKHAAPWS